MAFNMKIDIESSKELTKGQASAVIEELQKRMT